MMESRRNRHITTLITKKVSTKGPKGEMSFLRLLLASTNVRHQLCPIDLAIDILWAYRMLLSLWTCLADGGRRRCAREDCAQNSKASVSRHCISEYVQKGARGSCIPKELRVEWCNTCYMTYPPPPKTPLTVDTVETRIIILVYSHSYSINSRFVPRKTTLRTSLHRTKRKIG